MLPDDDAEIAKIKAAWKAGIEAAPLSFPYGDGADLSSIPGDLGSEVGGMQRGEVSDLHPCPAAKCPETDGVAGTIGGGSIPLACNPKAARRSPEAGSASSVQLRLQLPGCFAVALLRLPEALRGPMMMLALHSRIGNAFSLPELLSSVRELQRVGVLLKQALRCDLSGDLKARIKDVLPCIDQLRSFNQTAVLSLGGNDSPPPGASEAITEQVRLRVPNDFGEALLKLRPALRKRALMLALNDRIGGSLSLPKLLAAAHDLRHLGRSLNKELPLGKPEALGVRVNDVLALIDQVRPMPLEGARL